MDPIFFNFKKSFQLFELKDKFDYFKDLILDNRLPKVTLLSGEKGSGKSTLVSHLMHYFFDRSNYDLISNKINKESNFHNMYLQNIYPNVIFLEGSNFKNIKIEDIRNLKNILLNTPVIDNKRFIILDDVEVFNLNSLNALLKIIEEPSKNNYFILINNKSRSLLETLRSRCIEFSFFLNEEIRKKIINLLIAKHDQIPVLDKDLIPISPGIFLKYNYILNENNININENFSENFKSLLYLSKKNKKNLYQNLLYFLTDYYFKQKMFLNLYDQSKIFKKRNLILKKINEFILLNLNSTILLNLVEKNLVDEK